VFHFQPSELDRLTIERLLWWFEQAQSIAKRIPR
jgi:hypothetical protein